MTRISLPQKPDNASWSLFLNLLKSNITDLESILIDIHCHILAEVDDGPRSWDVAQEMCRMAAADGIEHIVATPHANDRYAYDRPSLLSSLDHLRELIGHKPQLSLGCDFHVSYENMKAVLARPHDFTIQGTRYLLVELSNFSIPTQVDEFFTQLNGAGLTPILTHPERNPILQQSAKRVLQWIELGCAVQVTASALTGGWGERAWRTAKWLLEREAVHVLSTDAHDTMHRPPVLSAGRQEAEEICGPKVAKALVDDNPRAIVCGALLPYFPDPVLET